MQPQLPLLDWSLLYYWGTSITNNSSTVLPRIGRILSADGLDCPTIQSFWAFTLFCSSLNGVLRTVSRNYTQVE
ncbi:hypothetical protein ACRALDRAFT_2060159 [Sodiomyces alcalophilus JCM 7366]|uniref:uncharacterized protein n=1 Tax=Sodiomyces alcalophilus JCM 7366 TaxID=591952 RepID=UPI0039B52572